MVTPFLQVAFGGAFGAAARYLTGLALVRALGQGFPYPTLAVNVVGSFFMGAFVVLAAQKSFTHVSPLIQTGILGGFTTFSSFSLDTVALLERGETALAALYVALSVCASIGALFCGLLLARAVFA